VGFLVDLIYTFIHSFLLVVKMGVFFFVYVYVSGFFFFFFFCFFFFFFFFFCVVLCCVYLYIYRNLGIIVPGDSPLFFCVI